MTNYKELNLIAKTYFSETRYEISVLSNASALLNSYLEDVSWVGFYLLKNNELILGPFQGRIACTNIPVGKGVCGTAILKLETQIVKNVHEFEGHIACDSRSNSEIVIPIFVHNKPYGVLDIDSTSFQRFTQEDEKELSLFLKEITKVLETII